MAKKKAKWLEESTLSIAEAIVIALTAKEVTDKEITKALKGAEEIKERAALDEAEPTVHGLLAKVSAALVGANELVDQAGGLYTADLEAAGVNESEDSDDEGEDEEETPKVDKKKKSKKAKEATTEPDVDLQSMSKRALRVYAKEAGVKTNKKMEKDEIIEAIEAAK